MSRHKQSDAVIADALADLMTRDADPLIKQWSKDFIAKHSRYPTNQEMDAACDSFMRTLSKDKARYHFSNLKPVPNADGKTWRLEHVHLPQ